LNLIKKMSVCFLLTVLVSTVFAAPPNPNCIYNRDAFTGEFTTLKPGINLSEFMGIDNVRTNYILQPDGIEYVLVLKIDFPDKPGTRSGDEIDGYFFGEDEVSLKTYYDENSYGKMKVEPGYLNGCMPRGNNWYRASRSMGYYGQGKIQVERYKELVREACQLADDDVDFSKYDRDRNGVVDHLFVIHSGDDEASTFSGTYNENIWSILVPSINTQYDGVMVDTASMAAEEPSFEKPHLGIYFHEFFHDFGAPDIYGNGSFTDANDNKWCLMGQFGPYQGPNQNGLEPSHICGYLKWDFDARPENGFIGWIEPTEIKQNSLGIEVDCFELKSSQNKMFKVDLPGTNGREYFLITNRYKESGARYDTAIPKSGILVWHVDEKKVRPLYAVDAAQQIWLEDPSDPNHSDLEHITEGAPFAADYGFTSFTPSTFPNTNTNMGLVTNISITNIGNVDSFIPMDIFFGDTYEPNDSIENAFGPVELGVQYDSFIYDEDDKVDFYKFNVARNILIIITLSNIPELANYYLQLFDSSGNLLIQTDSIPAEDKQIMYRTVNDGELYVAVSTLGEYSRNDSYILMINLGEIPDLAELENIKVYPNPVRQYQKLTFEHPQLQLADSSEIKIFNINGRLVYEKLLKGISSDKFEWNLKNISGNTIANGIYIYLITAERGEQSVSVHGKFAIER